MVSVSSLKNVIERIGIEKILIIAVITSMFFIPFVQTLNEAEATQPPTKKPIHLPAPENTEKAILAEYIKCRNSKVPDELAVLQASIIIDVSAAHEINYVMINGIIEQESIYDPLAVSSAGAKGLMQILKEDGVQIDPGKAHDLRYNIDRGIAILKSKMQKSNDTNESLIKYSGGKKDYAKEVYSNIGRYTLYRESKLHKETSMQ